MSHIDDMKVMLGRGMNAADRKSQQIRLQSELSDVDNALGKEYKLLGKSVLDDPVLQIRVQTVYPHIYERVSQLISSRQVIQARIDELRKPTMPPAPQANGDANQVQCPGCGQPVMLDYAYCPSCGDNLVRLKAHYRMCSTCKTYYTRETVFCIQCGSKTVPLSVAPTMQVAQAQTQDEAQAQSQDEAPVQSQDVTTLSEPVTPATINVVQDAPVPQESDASFEPMVTPEPPEPSSELQAAPVVTVRTGQVEVVSQGNQALRCPVCGSEVSQDDIFCGECGFRLKG